MEDSVDGNRGRKQRSAREFLWKILKHMGIPDHLTFLLRNLYAGQEATVRTRHIGLVPNWERSTSRLYIVTPLIYRGGKGGEAAGWWARRRLGGGKGSPL